MSDLYRTPARHAQTELREKGSRFIAEVFVVESPEEAEERIAAVRRREYAATHHCTAYRTGTDGTTFRYNDDGEPSGTAGIPILRQIDARGLTQTLVVVTRYFGGTKLGTGGLARAYGAAASEALDAAGTVEREIRTALRIAFAYDDTAAAMHVINRFDGRIEASEYSDRTVLTVTVRRSAVDTFQAAIVEALAGRGEIGVNV
ncbi:MAG TPA: YigZ family protein [Rhodothermales bacterium]